MKLPTLSIRATVLLAIVLGMVVPALLVLMVDSRLSREAHEPIVHANRSATLVLAASVITEPAWTLSEPGLQVAIARILHQPSVCGLEVSGLQPLAKPLEPPRGTCADNVPTVARETDVLFEGQRIAHLRIHFDDTEIDRLLAERRRVAVYLVAAQVVVGVIILAAVLSLRLLRPIDRLKAQAGQLAAREAGPALAWRRNDELGQLGSHLDEVRSRIQGLFGELEAKNAQLRRLAMHDHLTGLPNRTLLRELFAREAAVVRRDGGSLALLFIDLDRFKTVNDTQGHAAGDELLVGIAQRLVASLRASDVVCRMGGDEFLVLLSCAEGWDRVAATAERLLRAIEQPMLLQRAAMTVQVSASIGVALYPTDGEDFDALSRTADLAMYRSKDLGRGRYSFYHTDLDTAFRERLELEHELRRALARHEFVLHYQPVYDAISGRIVGCEALMRWQHPERGLLLPGSFIATAEETGLIREMGRWTLQTACAQMAAWKASGHAPPRVAVNVSALQIHDEHLEATLRQAMLEHRIQPGELELELTESTLIGDTDAVLATVESLRATGALLALDDFGTGFSSLSYLKRLRPDKVKIDRSFVRDLPGDADDRALTQAILGICRALGMTVVAEGVETEAQRDYLAALGCTLQQGWLHGKPMPAHDLQMRLRHIFKPALAIATG